MDVRRVRCAHPLAGCFGLVLSEPSGCSKFVWSARQRSTGGFDACGASGFDALQQPCHVVRGHCAWSAYLRRPARASPDLPRAAVGVVPSTSTTRWASFDGEVLDQRRTTPWCRRGSGSRRARLVRERLAAGVERAVEGAHDAAGGVRWYTGVPNTNRQRRRTSRSAR